MGICKSKSRVTNVNDPPPSPILKETTSDTGSTDAKKIPENKLYPTLPNVPSTINSLISTTTTDYTSEEYTDFGKGKETGVMFVRASDALDHTDGNYKNITMTQLLDSLTDKKDDEKLPHYYHNKNDKEPETSSNKTEEKKTIFAINNEEKVIDNSYELTKGPEIPYFGKNNLNANEFDDANMDAERTNTYELKMINDKPRSENNTLTSIMSFKSLNEENLHTTAMNSNIQKKGGGTEKKAKKKKSLLAPKDDKTKKQNKFEEFGKDPKDKRIKALEIRVQELERENGELLMRLSRAAGAALCLNNPDIADLSDMNRPTRIQERYSELYDNEWTDAFDSLHALYSEEEAIALLLKLFMVIFQVCQRIATEQLESLNVFGAEESIPKETMKLLMDNRKKKYKKYLKRLNPHIKERIDKEFTVAEDKKKIKPYLKVCRETCWLMVIQDPPMVMDTHIDRRGEAFDKDVFKEYTESGKMIKFVVWPPLYLHKNGPLMMKGVAQGYN